MVKAAGPPPQLPNLREALRRDLGGFLAALAPPAPPQPGLYTYRLTPPGGQVRIHLRIEDGGAGVLFVDVTDVIHLNPTAAEMAKMALDGVPPEQARAGLLRRFRDADGGQLTRQLGQIYEMIDRFRNPAEGCPTCAVPFLQRKPLFSTRARAPYKADIALTYTSNNKCAHCYNEPDRLTMPSLPAADWRRVLDKLAEVGVPHIIFTGGEATLHPELPDLIRHADRLGQIAGLNTNGRRLAHKPYLQTLVEAGLNHVQITLGSCRPEIHDAMTGAASFRQTVRGIENALQSPLHTITNTTLMRCNVDHVEEIVEFLHTLGLRTFAMNGMIYSGGGFAHPDAIPEEEMAPLLIRVRDRAAELGMRFLWYTPTEYCRLSPVELGIDAKRCNAAEYSICVEPNGDVLPCQSYYVTAGNILRDPWDEIWEGELFRSFREREEDPRRAGLPEKCWECPDLSLCGGGCRIEREKNVKCAA
jgi:radical SAM protein with 4Fe4S-binding SPASM domain